MASRLQKGFRNLEGIVTPSIWMCEFCGLFHESKADAEKHERDIHERHRMSRKLKKRLGGAMRDPTLMMELIH